MVFFFGVSLLKAGATLLFIHHPRRCYCCVSFALLLTAPDVAVPLCAEAGRPGRVGAHGDWRCRQWSCGRQHGARGCEGAYGVDFSAYFVRFQPRRSVGGAPRGCSDEGAKFCLILWTAVGFGLSSNVCLSAAPQL